eukprot:273082-Rhodomonas_salina.2
MRSVCFYSAPGRPAHELDRASFPVSTTRGLHALMIRGRTYCIANTESRPIMIGAHADNCRRIAG